MLTAVSSDEHERELQTAAARVQRAEAVVAELRARRDQLVRVAIRQHGLSERRAASAAALSPSYAHRLARAGRS